MIKLNIKEWRKEELSWKVSECGKNNNYLEIIMDRSFEIAFNCIGA